MNGRRVAEWVADADNLSKTLACATVAGALCWFLWFVWDTNLNLSIADMGAVVLRFRRLVEGKIGLLYYLFTLHGDHFHALIFALGALDMKFFGGDFLLPRTVGALAILATALGLGAVVLEDGAMSRGLRWSAAALAVAATLSGLAVEVWAFSFQAVVSTFRFLFTAALGIGCLAAFRGSWRLTTLAGSGTV